MCISIPANLAKDCIKTSNINRKVLSKKIYNSTSNDIKSNIQQKTGTIIAKKLIAEDRVNFICKADYQEDKDIYKVVKRILQKIKADYDFNRLLEFHKNKALCNV